MRQCDIKYFSESELGSFFSVLKKSRSKYAARDEFIFTLIYSWGLRIGELVRIRLVDIKPDANDPAEIHIQRLKGGVPRHYPMEITAAGTDFYKLHRRWMHVRDKLKNAKQNEFLFITGHSGLNHISIVYLQQEMVRICARAGIQRHLAHPHTLRHSCAVSLINNGADIYQVSAHLGHTSIKTTIDFYAQLSNKDWQKKAARNIRTRLAGI